MLPQEGHCCHVALHIQNGTCENAIAQKQRCQKFGKCLYKLISRAVVMWSTNKAII